jgi:hypothetical protein
VKASVLLFLRQRWACCETRAYRALLSMRRLEYAMRRVLVLRSGRKDRVSKDATNGLAFAKRAPVVRIEGG